MAAQLLTKAEDAESLDGDGSDRTNSAGAVCSGPPHRPFWGDWSRSKWLARQPFRTSAFPDCVKTRCNICEAEHSSTEVYRDAIGTAGMAGLAGRSRTGLNRGAGSHENPAAAGKRAAADRL